MNSVAAHSRVVFSAGIFLVIALRLLEVKISQRHTSELLRRGGVEFGREHYPWMVALHSTFFAAMLLELWVPRPTPSPTMAIVFGALFLVGFGLRVWAMRSLGPLWTTRVIRVAGDPRIARGPYRFLPHPNYLGVGLEILALPLVYSLWRSALLFSLLNQWMLRIRIRCEDAALHETQTS